MDNIDSKGKYPGYYLRRRDLRIFAFEIMSISITSQTEARQPERTGRSAQGIEGDELHADACGAML